MMICCPQYENAVLVKRCREEPSWLVGSKFIQFILFVFIRLFKTWSMLHRNPEPDLQASNSGQDLDQDQAYMGRVASAEGQLGYGTGGWKGSGTLEIMTHDFLTQEKQIPAPVPACFSPTATTRKQTPCGFIKWRFRAITTKTLGLYEWNGGGVMAGQITD